MWHYEKDHAEISRPEVVSVYSSHIQNVDFLNRNTERLSMRWDPINGYLEYSITWLTQLWSMPGYCKVSAKTGRTVINQQANRIDFDMAWTGSLHRNRTWCSDNWKSNKYSLFPHHKVRLNSDTRSPVLLEGPEGNMQKDTPYAVHKPFHVRNENLLLASKRTIIFPKKNHFN